MFSRFVRMSTLFGISIQHFFFFSPLLLSKQYFVLPFHFSKFVKNPFYFLLFWHFPFLFLFFSQFFPVLSLNKWNHSEMGCNTLNSICEWNNVSKIKHLTYKSHERKKKCLINKEQVVSWKDAKYIYTTPFSSQSYQYLNYTIFKIK